MTTIGWIRHGVTDWNLERRAQGQTDIPLNDAGRAQARLVAERLKCEEAWDIVYSSDLSRARETADTIGAALRLPVRVDARLREISFGTLEGTTPDERVLQFGSSWESMDFGRESPEAAAARGESFVADVLDRHPGERVLIVSHGALIGNTLRRLAPEAEMNEHLGNTSVTIFTFADAKWTCELYNCTKHIGERT
ncbi:histidine phosphatase family protein [Paenibacillus antri]|uniref:Histidine phosphatase family protein n=1 Tax=Paenibacillus antri TaxID=2582848 RepID=A0A5R9G9Y2_9BACL|nr:histidine phosphatase family protein [Paenibacillus antri]TLS52551.1 histidine phosphatase family protein [Paenibacillus antri]